MAGRIIRLNGVTFENPIGGKLVKIDPIESAGSLLLIDPMHPYQQWASGVPANGVSVPNLVWENAASVYGSGDASSLAAPVKQANLDNTRGKAERTTKGGLHLVISQDDARVADALKPYFGIDLDAAFQAYQVAHPNNDLYISLWGRVTRIYRSGTVAGTYTTLAGTSIFQMRAGGANQRMRVGNSNPLGNDLGGRVAPTVESALGNILVNTASSAWPTAPANVAAIEDPLVTIGGYGGANLFTSGTATAQARWPSWVLYRIYIEDLTVSGRTYAEVDALDLSLYQKEVLTVGGRYYNDTLPTDPATIA